MKSRSGFNCSGMANLSFWIRSQPMPRQLSLHRRQLTRLESAEAPLLEFLRPIYARSTVQFVPPVERDLISNAQSAVERVQKLKKQGDLRFARESPHVRAVGQLGTGKPVRPPTGCFLAHHHGCATSALPSTVHSAKLVSAAWNSLHPKHSGNFLGWLRWPLCADREAARGSSLKPRAIAAACARSPLATLSFLQNPPAT